LVISHSTTDQQSPIRIIRLKVAASSNSPPIPTISPTPGSTDNSSDDQNFEDDAYEQENNDLLEKSLENDNSLTNNFFHDAENFALIDGYDKFQEKFRDSRINSKTVWNNIADYVNENCRTSFTGRQCNKRWNYLRRQYTDKIQYGGRTGRSAKAAKWPFWDRMNSVLGNDPSVVPSVIAGSRGVRQPRLQSQASSHNSPSENSDETSVFFFNGLR